MNMMRNCVFLMVTTVNACDAYFTTIKQSPWHTFAALKGQPSKALARWPSKAQLWAQPGPGSGSPAGAGLKRHTSLCLGTGGFLLLPSTDPPAPALSMHRPHKTTPSTSGKLCQERGIYGKLAGHWAKAGRGVTGRGACKIREVLVSWALPESTGTLLGGLGAPGTTLLLLHTCSSLGTGHMHEGKAWGSGPNPPKQCPGVRAHSRCGLCLLGRLCAEWGAGLGGMGPSSLGAKEEATVGWEPPKGAQASGIWNPQGGSGGGLPPARGSQTLTRCRSFPALGGPGVTPWQRGQARAQGRPQLDLQESCPSRLSPARWGQSGEGASWVGRSLAGPSLARSRSPWQGRVGCQHQRVQGPQPSPSPAPSPALLPCQASLQSWHQKPVTSFPAPCP